MEFPGSNEEGRGGWILYKGVTPVARGGGGQAPLPHPWAGPSGRPRGDDRPLFFQGPRCKFEEKKLHLVPVALWGATGGIFEIFSKRTYIFEIFIFKKYKKEKTAEKVPFLLGHFLPSPAPAVKELVKQPCKRWPCLVSPRARNSDILTANYGIKQN